MNTTRETIRPIVLEAGRHVREAFGRSVTIDFKGEIDLVTDVDRKSEEIITSALQRAFPGDDILAEESGALTGMHSSRRWLVDPLDGTTNFAHAYPFIAVSIALEHLGQIVFGVVYDPLREEYFEAERGDGASLNGKTIQVSTTTELGRCLLCTGFPYDVKEHPEGHAETLGRALMAGQGIRRDGSAALDLCYVGCGRFDGYYERKLAPWDTAAGKLIVEEAGGKVTTYRGEPYSIYGKDVLATNGRIHNGMIKILTA